MQEGSNYTKMKEGNIFEELGFYKVIKSNNRHFMTFKNGSVSSIIKFRGINNTALQEDDFEDIANKIQQIVVRLNNPKISVQFLMKRSNDINVENENVPSFLRPRLEYVNTLAKNYQLFKNDFYISIFYHGKEEKEEGLLTQIVNKFKKKDNDEVSKQNESFKGIRDRIDDVIQLTDSFYNFLRSLDLKESDIKILNSKEEYYDVLQTFTRRNKSSIEKIEIDDSKESPSQALFSGVRAKVSDKGFILDDYFHKAYTLDRVPTRPIYGKSIDILQSFPAEFIYSVTFKTVPHEESIKLFNTELFKNKLEKQQDSNNDRSIEKAGERIDESYDMFVDGESVGVDVSVNFIFSVKEEFLDKIERAQNRSRAEIIRRYEQDLYANVFRSFGNSEWVSEENLHWYVYNGIIPGCSELQSNLTKIKSIFIMDSNLPYLLPMYDNNRGHLEHNGINHLIDSKSNLYVLDLLDESLPAWNYLLSGQTGSGKSVMMNTLLAMEMAYPKKPVICIIDLGGDVGSYQNFIELNKGEEINFSRAVKPNIQLLEIEPSLSLPTPDKIKDLIKKFKNKITNVSDKDLENLIRDYYYKFLEEGSNQLTQKRKERLFKNVFEIDYDQELANELVLAPGTCEPSEKDLSKIMAIFEIMLSDNLDNPEAFRTKYVADDIAMQVQEIYRETKDRFPYISDFYRMCKENMPTTGQDLDDAKKDTNNKFLNKIKAWTKEGLYHYFDSDTSINLSNDIILADLKGLESNPALQMIYSMLISKLFGEKMYGIKNRRKIMVRDEAWSLLKNKRARMGMVEDFRTARKHRFANISISQKPDDYYNPSREDGEAIIGQAQVKIIGKLNKPLVRKISKENNYNKEIENEMMTLGLDNDKTYSKYMIDIEEKDFFFVKNMLHPFEYMIYSSSKQDRDLIDYYKNETDVFDIERYEEEFSYIEDYKERDRELRAKRLEDILWFIAKKQHLKDADLAKYIEDGNPDLAKQILENLKR